MLRDAYGVTPVHAGFITGGLAFLGSASRPIGGIIADRVGGARMLAVLMIPIACAYAFEASAPALPLMIAALALSMMSLGLGNGAVFQIVPQRFQRNIGAVTGLVGAVGGLGGFVLPTMLGTVREHTGTFAAGFGALAVVASCAALALRGLLSSRGKWATAAVAE
jgi:NNP family nitrate/nitrite transporter-like MFS transporter